MAYVKNHTYNENISYFKGVFDTNYNIRQIKQYKK